MKGLGIIARGDNRGLANQTWEAVRHLEPEKVVGIDMCELSPFENHWSRFPGATIVRYDQWDDHAMDSFLEGLTCVYVAETSYRDDVFYNVARSRGVRTVLQYNYEFCRQLVDPDLSRPDIFLAPSHWFLERVPNAVLLPFPVDRERLPFRLRTEGLTFLHVAGHRTRMDRNGTDIVMLSLQYVREDITFIVTTQDPIPTSLMVQPSNSVKLDVRVGNHENYEDPYLETNADVAVLPRRWGGLCLPLNEASSCGMPTIMPAVSPQIDLLPAECLVTPWSTREMTVIPGMIPLYDLEPTQLASKINELAAEPALVEGCSRAVDAYAESISWETLLPRYVEVLTG